MWRWKVQRSSIGMLPASAWCFSSVCKATTTGLASRIAARAKSAPPRSLIRRAGGTSASQSTTLPSTENRIASKAPVIAVHTVIQRIHGRTPRVHCQRNAKKPRGGVSGSAAG
jgi:hypothetical protein